MAKQKNNLANYLFARLFFDLFKLDSVVSGTQQSW